MDLNKICWFNYPIKHAILENPVSLEMANYMYKNFPKHEYDKFVNNDQVWINFYKIVFNSLPNLTMQCDKNFDLFSHEQLQIEVKHWDWSEENTVELIKDWHTDFEDKKYQFLFYFGNVSKGGSLEMKNETNHVVKHIPFKHNRLIIWPVNNGLYHFPRSLHRFYSGLGSRKTVNFKLKY